jgi:hypothetical protein
LTWNQRHSASERFANDAETAIREGDAQRAEDLYKKAATEEAAAFEALDADKHRSRGITAVSAVALWYKGRDYASAEQFVHQCLGRERMPLFAAAQLRELLQMIWTVSAAEKAGVKFIPGDVLVSVKGGQIIHGGAPLDLILRKEEGIQALLLRTVEMLMKRPFRRRGAPSAEIMSMFRPWLFHAPAGSYQFAVKVQEPEQMDLWAADRPTIEGITTTFLKVLRASASDPEAELPSIVPDAEYRGAFLSLARNLAPTGKTFERLEVREASTPAAPVVSFASDTRQQLNVAIRNVRPLPPKAADESVAVRGILRGVHLDHDWLEVTTVDGSTIEHIRVEQAGDALDDVVGPMVNRKVVVSAVHRGKRFLYRDIELDE